MEILNQCSHNFPSNGHLLSRNEINSYTVLTHYHPLFCTIENKSSNSSYYLDNKLPVFVDIGRGEKQMSKILLNDPFLTAVTTTTDRQTTGELATT